MLGGWKKAGRSAKRKKAFFYAAGLLLLIGGGAVLAGLFSATRVSSGPLPGPQIRAELSGFKAGTTVSYRIIPGTGAPVKGAASVGENGSASVPASRFDHADGQGLVYDFTIGDGQRSLGILMNFDRKTGDVSIRGRGAEPFGKIRFGAAGQEQDIYSDWAGIFEARSAEGGRGAGERQIRLAFNNVNSVNDAWPGQNAAFVEIIYAPGGGQLDGAGLNEFDPTPYCGDPPLSICDIDSMESQIEGIIENLVIPLQLMAEQLSVVIAQQTPIFGTFLDAKEQMDAQREMQKLKAIAVKDYHPSEQMCKIGSFVRSLPSAEMKAATDRLAMSDTLMERYTNASSTSSSHNMDNDVANRLQQFRTIYCDPADNNNGLLAICEHDQDNNLGNSTRGAVPPGGIGASGNLGRVNKDIDFVRTLESAYTLDVDFSDDVMTPDEQDVVALARNLYWPEPYKIVLQKMIGEDERDYLRSRRIMAMKNIAHDSFVTLVGMKSKAPEAPAGVQPGWSYMKTMMREFGMTDPNIELLVGARPSYYAQMDMLTKRIFQDPDFYTNLYDKPVNVSRIGASLTAIKLMQMRDQYESALRREMLFSALVEEKLAANAEKIQGEMNE